MLPLSNAADDRAASPFAAMSNVGGLETTLTVGGTRSKTVAVTVSVAVNPFESVAVSVITCGTPTSLHPKLDLSIVVLAMPQLSLELACTSPTVIVALPLESRSTLKSDLALTLGALVSWMDTAVVR